MVYKFLTRAGTVTGPGQVGWRGGWAKGESQGSKNARRGDGRGAKASQGVAKLTFQKPEAVIVSQKFLYIFEAS